MVATLGLMVLEAGSNAIDRHRHKKADPSPVPNGNMSLTSPMIGFNAHGRLVMPHG